MLKDHFSKIKFDFKAIMNLPKIIKETKKGDAYIINFITRLFEKEGFKIISQTHYNSELVLFEALKLEQNQKKIIIRILKLDIKPSII